MLRIPEYLFPRLVQLLDQGIPPRMVLHRIQEEQAQLQEINEELEHREELDRVLEVLDDDPLDISLEM